MAATSGGESMSAMDTDTASVATSVATETTDTPEPAADAPQAAAGFGGGGSGGVQDSVADLRDLEALAEAGVVVAVEEGAQEEEEVEEEEEEEADAEAAAAADEEKEDGQQQPQRMLGEAMEDETDRGEADELDTALAAVNNGISMLAIDSAIEVGTALNSLSLLYHGLPLFALSRPATLCSIEISKGSACRWICFVATKPWLAVGGHMIDD